MHLSRRRFLLGAGATTAGLLVGASAGARVRSVVETHALKAPHLDLAGLRVAHLTDLHVDSEAAVARATQAVHEVNQLAPDLALLTGDYVSWGTSYLDTAAELLGRLRMPSYAVLGNHDHKAGAENLTAALTARGITVLDNRSVLLTRGNARLRLIGVGDSYSQHDDVKAACADLASDDDGRIVLCHNPASADDLPAGCADLILAGHTHGGQIKVAVISALLIRHFGTSYIAGFYRTPAGLLYVNRGWGTVGIPLRLAAPAEIALFGFVA